DGVVRSTCGAIEAWSVGADSASRTLDQAQVSLQSAGDRLSLAVLDLNRGHVELAEASLTRLAGNVEKARELLRSARRRLASALMSGPEDEKHPGGTPSAADQSDDVRLA